MRVHVGGGGRKSHDDRTGTPGVSPQLQPHTHITGSHTIESIALIMASHSRQGQGESAVLKQTLSSRQVRNSDTIRRSHGAGDRSINSTHTYRAL